MSQALIGAGGWGYFSGGLETYAQGYRFVEVNATFYRRIPEVQAQRWRARVPADFVFSVKGHRDVTHTDGVRSSASGRSAFASTLRTARILRAPFVVLETPPSVAFDEAQRDGLRNLAAMVDGSTRLGLEVRAFPEHSLPPELRSTMEREAILDVVDISQTAPRIPDDDLYSRLFGPGPHNRYEFDDAELGQIDRAGSDAVRAAFAFHGVRMYKDSARLLTFKRTGTFPAATGSRGLASLDEVLRPDAQFPASRDDLVRDHGWKVFDLEEDRRAHASQLLESLPNRTFRGLDEVIRALERMDSFVTSQTPGTTPTPGPRLGTF